MMNKRAAVFISAGLGDALLLVPLLKQLNRDGVTVTGIFTDSSNAIELFEETTLFENKITLKKNLAGVFKCIFLLKKFDAVYLNYFAASRGNFFLSALLTKQIITNRILQKLPQNILRKIKFVEPQKNIHDATQNLLLTRPDASDDIFNEDGFALDFKLKEISGVKFQKISQALNSTYFSIQVGSGNESLKYKNWTLSNWSAFLKLLSDNFPKHHFILLGTAHDEPLSKQLMEQKTERVLSVVGKTNLQEAIALIGKSQLFIGLDGGLMHIAAYSGKPTFTLWGPSDNTLYGYEKINGKKHKVIRSDVYCRPCESWISPNTARVNHPLECPDFMCMQKISAVAAFSEFKLFYQKLFTD